jgi:hypothetical protein
MAKFDANKGQSKTHMATRTLPDGTVETQGFTQEEWRDRDKAAGWVRDADDESDIPEEPSA